jgi:hypothetical protein
VCLTQQSDKLSFNLVLIHYPGKIYDFVLSHVLNYLVDEADC